MGHKIAYSFGPFSYVRLLIAFHKKKVGPKTYLRFKVSY